MYIYIYTKYIYIYIFKTIINDIPIGWLLYLLVVYLPSEKYEVVNWDDYPLKNMSSSIGMMTFPIYIYIYIYMEK